MVLARHGFRRWSAIDLQASAQGVFQGASGFAVLAAGLWAGFLWGDDGRLPLLISGIAGGVFASRCWRVHTVEPARHLDVVERERRLADTDDGIASPRRSLGDARVERCVRRPSGSPAVAA